MERLCWRVTCASSSRQSRKETQKVAVEMKMADLIVWRQTALYSVCQRCCWKESLLGIEDCVPMASMFPATFQLFVKRLWYPCPASYIYIYTECRRLMTIYGMLRHPGYYLLLLSASISRKTTQSLASCDVPMLCDMETRQDGVYMQNKRRGKRRMTHVLPQLQGCPGPGHDDVGVHIHALIIHTDGIR